MALPRLIFPLIGSLSLFAQACVVEGSYPETETAYEVQTEPPPPREEVVTVRPSPDHVWVHGHYWWNGRRYVWIAGHWRRERVGCAWVRGEWIRGPGGWRWIPGHCA